MGMGRWWEEERKPVVDGGWSNYHRTNALQRLALLSERPDLCLGPVGVRVLNVTLLVSGWSCGRGAVSQR